MLARPPQPQEIDLLTKSLARFRDEYASAPAEARALLDVGSADDASPEAAAEDRDLAAYTLLASLLLCRDEAVMRN